VLCHNPSNTSNASPKVAINFPFLIHSIHFGDNMQPYGVTYKVGNSDFSGVRFPALNLQGTPGDVTNCGLCHVNGSEAVFPIGKNAVQTPNLLLNPTPATTAACVACHVTTDTLAHAQVQTDPRFGESCSVCHAGTADFAVGKMHAGK
jgi:OmcA/MtrC family decaheme c-type cytochrome